MDKTQAIAMIVPLTLIVGDYITGVAKAIAAHDINSEKMRTGLWHKATYIFAVSLGVLIDFAQQHIDLGFSVPIATAACIWISFTEITSILENLVEINPELADSPVLDLFHTNKTNPNK